MKLNRYIAFMLGTTMIYMGLNARNELKVEQIKEIKAQQQVVKEQNKVIDSQITEMRESIKERNKKTVESLETSSIRKDRVVFTNFQDNTLATPLNKNHFEVDGGGIYRYEGCIVGAAAHNNLKNYGFELEDGYNTHDLYEKIEITIDGKKDCMIILDVCGACMGHYGENHQRYDILTNYSDYMWEEGYVYE